MKAKKFCIIALVLAIALFIAPISESRAELKTSGDYEYIVLDDGTACITKYNGEDEKVIVPEKLDGINVTCLGDKAFYECKNLKEITIPDSVEKIDNNPFYVCENLLNINISADHPTLAFIDNALFYKPEKKIVSYLSTSKESKYEIPEGIKIIGDGAFSWCTNLTEIKIPDSVQSIGEWAFSWCTNLTEITIPDGVKSIGDAAFAFCKNLKEITIPDSVEEIEDNPFFRCENLLNINISANNPTLEFVDNALIYKPEKKIVSYLIASKESKYEIPDRIESIGEWAFSKCINLTEVKIPDSVQSIEDSVFSLCTNLTETKISDGVKSIGDSVFYGCDNLKKINIPASVNTIGEDAFEDCNNLTATVARDSYAEKYCKENNIKYMYEDSLDWLKN